MCFWLWLQVMVSDVGQSLPWYFPFQPSYWQGQHSQAGAGMSPFKPTGSSDESLASHRLRSASSEECTVAVSIQGLTKVYQSSQGDRKYALDGLTLDMYQGHVTALLGKPLFIIAVALLHAGSVSHEVSAQVFLTES